MCRESSMRNVITRRAAQPTGVQPRRSDSEMPFELILTLNIASIVSAHSGVVRLGESGHQLKRRTLLPCAAWR
jgi:hypothetical protein